MKPVYIAFKFSTLQEIIQDRLTELNTRAAHRSDELERTKLLQAYVRESDELGEWIEEQYQVASSEDFGQDYEHLQVSLHWFVILVLLVFEKTICVHLFGMNSDQSMLFLILGKGANGCFELWLLIFH